MKKIALQRWTLVFWAGAWAVILIQCYFLLALSFHPKEWIAAATAVGASPYFYYTFYPTTAMVSFMIGWQFYNYFKADPNIQE